MQAHLRYYMICVYRIHVSNGCHAQVYEHIQEYILIMKKEAWSIVIAMSKYPEIWVKFIWCKELYASLTAHCT